MSSGIQFDPPSGARFDPPATGRSPAWAFRAGAGVASLLLASTLIVTTSRAAFNTSTDNVGNSINAGDVVLTDDDLAASRFAITAMEPGESVTRCIVVTYNGSVDPSTVRMYSGGYTEDGAATLDDFLNVSVDEGTGGSYSSCATPSAFIADDAPLEFANTLTFFEANHNSYLTGFGDWDPTAAGQSKTYQITVELDAAAPNSVQNQSVTNLTFIWEVVN